MFYIFLYHNILKFLFCSSVMQQFYFYFVFIVMPSFFSACTIYESPQRNNFFQIFNAKFFLPAIKIISLQLPNFPSLCWQLWMLLFLLRLLPFKTCLKRWHLCYFFYLSLFLCLYYYALLQLFVLFSFVLTPTMLVFPPTKLLYFVLL